MDQEFYLPCGAGKVLRELRRLLVPRILGSSGSMVKSRQAFRLSGSNCTVVIKESASPSFYRLASMNPRVDSVFPKGEVESAGDMRDTDRDGVFPSTKVVPEQNKTRLNAEKTL